MTKTTLNIIRILVIIAFVLLCVVPLVRGQEVKMTATVEQSDYNKCLEMCQIYK